MVAASSHVRVDGGWQRSSHERRLRRPRGTHASWKKPDTLRTSAALAGTEHSFICVAIVWRPAAVWPRVSSAVHVLAMAWGAMGLAAR